MDREAEKKVIAALQESYRSRSDDKEKGRKILDSFSEKTQWRRVSFVHRIAQETHLSEREVRDFLKKVLQPLNLGKFIKGSQGSKSRFEWKVEDGISLIRVGQAARDESDTVREWEGDVITENDDDDDAEISLEYSLPKGRNILVKCPQDVSSEELELFLPWLKMHIASLIKH